MTRKLSKDAWLLIGLLVFLLIAMIVAGGGKGNDSDNDFLGRSTSYSSKKTGVKALYETLDRLDYPVHRKLTDLSEAPASGVLFLISPDSDKPITEEEWRSVMRWVEDGNVLIATPPSFQVSVPGAPDTPTLQTKPVCPSRLSAGVRYFRTATDDLINPPTMTLEQMKHKFTQPKGKKDVVLPDLGSGTHATALFMDDSYSSSAISMKLGKGSVILLSSGWPLTNEGIGRSDNLIVALNGIGYKPGRLDAVTFDEYHHGYVEQQGMMSLINVPARLGLAILVLAFILVVFSSSRRFGRVMILREGVRQRGEYLYSMAALIRKAHAISIVRKELGHRFLADMAKAVGLPVGARVETIVQAAAARCPAKADQIEELCTAAISNDVTGGEVATLALVRKWHSMRKEILK